MFRSIFLMYISLHIALGQHGIVEQPKPVVISQGQDANLNCTVSTSATSYNVFWYYMGKEGIATDGTEKHISTNNKIELVFERQSYQIQVLNRQSDNVNLLKKTYLLTLKKVQPYQLGTYRCILQIVGNYELKKYIDVSLQVKVPPSIVLGLTTTNIEALAGQDVILSCNATGYPQPNITFSRTNGKPIPGTNGIYTYRGNSMKIPSITIEDRGVYRCHADNTVPEPVIFDIPVQVHFAPYGRVVQRDYGQYPCSSCDLSIECIIGGEPDPEVKWYRVSGNTLGLDIKTLDLSLRSRWTELPENAKYNIMEWKADNGFFTYLDINEIFSRLTIRNIRDDDFGFYICEGANRYNRSSISIEVWKSDQCHGPLCPINDFAAGNSAATPIFRKEPIIILKLMSLFIFFRCKI